jgi:hypothetical protein
MSNVVIWLLWLTTAIMVWPDGPPGDTGTQTMVVVLLVISGAVALIIDRARF